MNMYPLPSFQSVCSTQMVNSTSAYINTPINVFASKEIAMWDLGAWYYPSYKI